jgi:hypothetical protein
MVQTIDKQQKKNLTQLYKIMNKIVASQQGSGEVPPQEPKPKRQLSEKQLANLQAGRETRQIKKDIESMPPAVVETAVELPEKLPVVPVKRALSQKTASARIINI